MHRDKSTGAVGALLGEYERAVKDLQNVIAGISDADLVEIVDRKTPDPDCISIQTILRHVVRSGYSYCIYIRDLRKMKNRGRGEITRNTPAEYIKDLDDVLEFTNETFENIQDNELEEYDQSKKIKTNWGQYYDIEQIFEHAIVHILRHRRQVEKFLQILKRDQ